MNKGIFATWYDLKEWSRKMTGSLVHAPFSTVLVIEYGHLQNNDKISD